MARLEGKTVIITGATSGIGKVAAIHLAKEGAKVIFSGRREELGKAVVSEIEGAGGAAVFVQGDVTNDTHLTSLFEAAGPSIDIVLANAGVEALAPLETYDAAKLAGEYDKLFGINVKAVMQTALLATPHLEKTKGMFIVTSSIAAVAPMAGMSIYAASKAAVDGFMRCYAAEVAPKGVRAYTLNPYAFQSEMGERAAEGMGAPLEGLAGALNPSGKVGTGVDFAEGVLILHSDSDGSKWPQGSNLAVDHGPTLQPVNEALPGLLKRMAAMAEGQQG